MSVIIILNMPVPLRPTNVMGITNKIPQRKIQSVEAATTLVIA